MEPRSSGVLSGESHKLLKVDHLRETYKERLLSLNKIKFNPKLLVGYIRILKNTTP